MTYQRTFWLYWVSLVTFLFIGLKLNFVDHFQLKNQHFTTFSPLHFLNKIFRNMCRVHRFLSSLLVFLNCNYCKLICYVRHRPNFYSTHNPLIYIIHAHLDHVIHIFTVTPSHIYIYIYYT